METIPDEIIAMMCARLPFGELWRLRRINRAWGRRAMATVQYRLTHANPAPFRLTLSVNHLRLTQAPSTRNSDNFPVELRLRSYNEVTRVFEFAPSADVPPIVFNVDTFGLHNNIKGVLEWCESDGALSCNVLRRNVTAEKLVSLRPPSWHCDDNRTAANIDDANKSFTVLRISRRNTSESLLSAVQDAERVSLATSTVSQEQHLLGFHCDLKYSARTDTETNTMVLSIEHFRISETGLFSLASPRTRHLIPQRGLFPKESMDEMLHLAENAVTPWFDEDDFQTGFAGIESSKSSTRTRSLKDLDRVLWIDYIQKGSEGAG